MRCARSGLLAFVAGLLAGAAVAQTAEEWSRDSEDLFPGNVPEDADGRPTWLVTRIVDGATGVPLPGAKMYAVAESPTPLTGEFWFTREVIADADGFARLPLAGIIDDFHWLFFEAEGYAPRAESSNTYVDPVIELRRGVDVPFVLFDAMAQPVGNALVGLMIGCGHTPDVRSVVTDENGAGVLRCIDPDSGDLWPVHERVYSDYVAWDWRVGDPPVAVHCDPGVTMEGLVVSADGDPMPGVFVGQIHAHRGPWVRTDEGGRFRLPGVARLDGLTVADARGETLGYFAGSEPGFPRTIRVPRNPHEEEITEPRYLVDFECRRDHDGTPAADVRIVAIRTGDGWNEWTRTDDEGYADLDLPPGVYAYRVGSTFGEFVIHEQHGAVTEAEPREPIAIRLRERPTMRIRTRGFPDDGVVVLVTSAAEKEITEAVALLAEAEPTPIPVPEAECVLKLVHDRRFAVFPVDREQVVRDGLLELPWFEPTVVKCRLVDGSGATVAGRVVLGADPAWDHAGDDPLASSETGDELTLETWRTGRAWLFAFVSGEKAPRTAVEVDLPEADGSTLDLGPIALPDEPRPALRVLLPDGSPAGGASVAMSRPGFQAWTEVAADGTLESRTIDPVAGARIRVEQEGLLPLDVVLEGDGPWILQWPSGGLLFDVRDPEGRPIERFTVLVDAEELSGEQGKLSLYGVPAGVRRMVLVARDRKAHLVQTVLKAGERLRIAVTLRER